MGELAVREKLGYEIILEPDSITVLEIWGKDEGVRFEVRNRKQVPFGQVVRTALALERAGIVVGSWTPKDGTCYMLPASKEWKADRRAWVKKRDAAVALSRLVLGYRYKGIIVDKDGWSVVDPDTGEVIPVENLAHYVDWTTGGKS